MNQLFVNWIEKYLYDFLGIGENIFLNDWRECSDFL